MEAGLRHHPDENHVAHVLRNGYILVTCDRDYLDERRFPLIQCPAIAVFNFGSGSSREIYRAYRSIHTAFRASQFYDKWTKIEASPNNWSLFTRHLDGTTARSRYRVHRGRIQEWIELNG